MLKKPSEMREAGFTIDDHCYPWFAYKGARFNPDEHHLCYTDREELLLSRQDEDLEYAIQLQRMIYSLNDEKSPTPYPQLHHHRYVESAKGRIKDLTAHLVSAYQQLDGVQ